MSRSGIADPEGFAADEVSGFLVGAVLIPIVIALGFLAFLGALAFSTFLGGPYAIAKVFFFFLLIPYGVFGGLFFFILKFARTLSKTAVKQGRETIKVTVEEVRK
jgi:hypothetical protein